MRRVMPDLGSLTRARRRTSHPGPTPGPGRCHPSETLPEASPGRPPRQAGMDRIPRRPEPGMLLRSVKNRVAQYNRGGIEALREQPRPGRPRSLAPEHYPRLKQRLEAPPRPEDGVCALRAADVRRILEREFGVTMGRQAVYDLLHRLGYSDLMPRPHHEDANPEVQAFFKEIVAEQIDAIAAEHPGKQVRVYFQDEARFGTQGTITRVWARRGSRPRAVRQNGRQWLYVLMAVCTATGAASA